MNNGPVGYVAIATAVAAFIVLLARFRGGTRRYGDTGSQSAATDSGAPSLSPPPEDGLAQAAARSALAAKLVNMRGRSRRKSSPIPGILFGLVLAEIGAYQQAHFNHAEAAYTKTPALIREVTVTHGKHTYYHFMVSFPDESGVQHGGRVDGGHFRSLHEGDSVPVMYDPADPDGSVMADPPGGDNSGYIMAGFGVFIFCMGSWNLLRRQAQAS